MKNKKFTYFLGFLVLAVWGVIVYRIVDSATGNEDDFRPIENKVSKEPYNDYDVPKDTTQLLLNYRDPFGLVRQKDTVTHIKNTTETNRPPVLSKPVFDWSFIKYSGYIRNPGSKNLVAVVIINGKSVMMQEGETTERVKLIKNLQDSIKVTFDGKTAYIKMQ
jgi:hypothetical protein